MTTNTDANTNNTAQDPAIEEHGEQLVGLRIEHDGFLWTITEYAKGWYKLENADGETKKARRGQFELLDEEPNEAAGRMSQTLAKYRQSYVPTLAASGKKSLSNGDPLALVLAGMDYEAVYALAEYWCELAAGSLEAKYRHLKNDGMRRMNAGNRLRALFKKAESGDVEEGSKADEFHDWVMDEEMRAASEFVSGEHGGTIFLRYGKGATGQDFGTDEAE